jgi:tyrosine-protein phosphatase YwqE
MFFKLAGKLKFFSNKSNTLLHTTDLHSHFIPAIDDGSKSLSESIIMLRRLEELGFKKIITTPHIMSHRFPNTQATIRAGYTLLKEELAKQNINIELEVAAEYYYDEHFLELIEKKEILSFGDNYVLFELSYHVKPFALEQVVSKLLNAGYKPVLAHPERYRYYTTQEHYIKLKEMGLLFQINAISTQNFYGKKVKQAVEKIIALDMVDFIGSDIHAQAYVDSFSKFTKSKLYAKIFEKNQIRNDYL